MPRIFKLDLQTHFGALKGALPLPDEPIRLAEFAFQIFPLEERLVGMAVKHATSSGKEKISCGPKCGACCRQAVPVSIPEAFLLRDLILSMPQARRHEVLSRFEAIQLRLQSESINLEIRSGESAQDRWLRVGLRYFKLGLACPFLEDESCSIHPHRPTVCREFLVTSSPSECGDPAKGTVRQIANPFSLPHCLARLTGVLMDQEPQLIMMPSALEYAEANAEWNEKRFDAGLLYSTLFDIVKFMAEEEKNLRV